MKTYSIFLIVLLFLVGCAKDSIPTTEEFKYNMGVSYEYNTALLNCTVNYGGTVKELVLHYSRKQDMSNEIVKVMKYNNLTRCYELTLDHLENQHTYYYQLEVKDGIGSFKNDIRSFKMDNGTIGQPHQLPYNQSFTNGVGSYFTQNLKGEQKWTFSNEGASVCGKSGQEPVENIDLLLSSPIQVKSVTDAKISMTYKASGFSSIMDEVKVLVTEGYRFEDDYWDFSWKRLPIKMDMTDQWKTIEIPLTQFLGKTVTVCVYYESSRTSAGKLEIKEINMASGAPDGGTVGALHYIPYFQSYTQGFGSFITYNIKGDQIWKFSDNRVWMSGKNGNTNKENEDWLLSSPISVKDISRIVVKICYTANGFSNLNNELKMFVSDSYHFGSSPANSTWKNGSVTWNGQSSEYGIATGYFDVSSSQTITFGLRYRSSTSSAGTVSIKYLCIETY